ncbi:hypothetical protein HL658_31380 [Azospirillum sp. RWY-5-1]|uniref:Uncharacterized protein n=1 Tax=Azospirillum oleiclasticum TaxID=2735135 RepID=A0ABX2TMC9_9PROT|nr:hypothetical protein [Azospirillum oleiclasticum]NYZ17068.1 hypothetical protein [Azospirillum oleiclasticum]NYZ24488.1 hypothetical protein [Azospirillum oleiclasticum]
MTVFSFNIQDRIDVVAPVKFKVPQSVQRAQRGAEIPFVTKTIFVVFRIPHEDEMERVREEMMEHNRAVNDRIAEASKRREGASPEERAEADREIDEATRGLRLQQVELLKAFIVGLPENHGIGDGDAPAEYSPELIERLCGFRFLQNALWEVFVKLLNGDAKKGN